MLFKCCSQYASKYRKLSSGHRTGKGQFSFQYQRNAMPKNAQTIKQQCSFHMLARLCSKSFKPCFSSMWTELFQMYKLDLEKAESQRSNCQHFGSQRKQENSRKTPTSASLTTWKPLTVWIKTNCGIFLKRWEYQITLSVSWETCMWVKKQQLEPDMEQWTGSKLGKQYVKAVYCYPAYLTYTQSTLWEMPRWMDYN